MTYLVKEAGDPECEMVVAIDEWLSVHSGKAEELLIAEKDYEVKNN